VPEIWAFEIANSIFVSYNKRKRISEQQISEYLSVLQALPIRVESQSLWTNVDLESLARRHNLAAYDAEYLDLALRSDLALATSDGPLRDAAIAEGITGADLKGTVLHPFRQLKASSVAGRGRQTTK